MKKPDTPFDNIENSHEYVSLLADAIAEAMTEIDDDIATSDAKEDARRREALQLVRFNLNKLATHMTSSRRILNDLRTLRRLLLDERRMEKALRQGGK